MDSVNSPFSPDCEPSRITPKKDQEVNLDLKYKKTLFTNDDDLLHSFIENKVDSCHTSDWN